MDIKKNKKTNEKMLSEFLLPFLEKRVNPILGTMQRLNDEIEKIIKDDKIVGKTENETTALKLEKIARLCEETNKHTAFGKDCYKKNLAGASVGNEVLLSYETAELEQKVDSINSYLEKVFKQADICSRYEFVRGINTICKSPWAVNFDISLSATILALTAGGIATFGIYSGMDEFVTSGAQVMSGALGVLGGLSVARVVAYYGEKYKMNKLKDIATCSSQADFIKKYVDLSVNVFVDNFSLKLNLGEDNKLVVNYVTPPLVECIIGATSQMADKYAHIVANGRERANKDIVALVDR